jgi:hypothetical protein
VTERAVVAALLLACAMPARAATPDTTAVWSVATPASVALKDDTTVALALTATRALESLKVVSTTLQEQTTKALVPVGRLRLGSAPGCDRGTTYDPAHPAPMLLCIGPLDPGTYVGTVSIGAANAGDPKPIALTLYATSTEARVLGTAAVALGLLVSWLVTVLLRNSRQRADAMLPASALREELDRLCKDAAAAARTLGDGAIAEPVIQRANDIAADLTEEKLDERGYLPSRSGNPFGNPTAPTTPYAQFIQDRAAEVGALAVLAAGLARLVALADRHEPRDVMAAARQIAEVAGTLPTPDAARAKVNEIIALLAAPRQEAALAGGFAGLDAPPLPSVRHVLLQRQLIDAGGWATWAVLTVAVGVYVLVLSNPGFGISLDYAKCFFWGLGLPFAGQQLQQLTPGSSASALAISVPRG